MILHKWLLRGKAWLTKNKGFFKLIFLLLWVNHIRFPPQEVGDIQAIGDTHQDALLKYNGLEEKFEL